MAGNGGLQKRDLLSLIGSLSHASKVVRSGRSFLRRLIDFSTTARQLDHYIRLNAEAKSDIEWWFQFAEAWNGVSLLSAWSPQPPRVTICSDASGSWDRWLQLQWAGTLEGSHISAKEPIVIAAALWGSQWKGKSVRALSDNTAAVAAINNQSSPIKEMAHMLRCLAFLMARCKFSLHAAHIPG